MEQHQIQIKCEDPGERDVDYPQFFEITFKCEDQEASDNYPLVDSTEDVGNYPQVTQIKIEEDEYRTEDDVDGSQLPLTRTFLHPEYEVNKCEITIEDTKLIYPVLPAQSSIEKPFQCIECLKKFVSKRVLKSHMSVHNEDRPFGCDICQKQFKTKDSIAQHMQLHASRKPVVCNECSKNFKTKNGLKLHMHIHTGVREKPFQCNMCPYKTATRSHLVLHTRIHTGEKPFRCKFCEKSFGTSSYLKTHSRIHTGEKPFVCDECPMTFRYKQALKRHKRSDY